MNSTIDNIIGFFFKRKYIVIISTIILSTIFLIDLAIYHDFNISAFGGTLYFGGFLVYIIKNQETLNNKFKSN